MVENVWGLVAVLVFYVVILVIGIVSGRKQLSRNSKADTTETMLAGRDIGMVSTNKIYFISFVFRMFYAVEVWLFLRVPCPLCHFATRSCNISHTTYVTLAYYIMFVTLVKLYKLCKLGKEKKLCSLITDMALHFAIL